MNPLKLEPELIGGGIRHSVDVLKVGGVWVIFTTITGECVVLWKRPSIRIVTHLESYVTRLAVTICIVQMYTRVHAVDPGLSEHEIVTGGRYDTGGR